MPNDEQALVPVRPGPINKSERGKALDEVRTLLGTSTPKACERLIEALDADRGIVVGEGDTATIEMVPDWNMRVKAAAIILDRVAGKPVQEIATEEGRPLEVVGTNSTFVLQLLKRLVGDIPV